MSESKHTPIIPWSDMTRDELIAECGEIATRRDFIVRNEISTLQTTNKALLEALKASSRLAALGFSHALQLQRGDDKLAYETGAKIDQIQDTARAVVESAEAK